MKNNNIYIQEEFVMSKKNKTVNNVTENTAENNVPENGTPEVVDKPKFGSKIMAGVKKHGKKAVAIAAAAGAGVLGYALGAKFGNKHDGVDEAYDYAGEDIAAVEFEEI